jgi:hypothetical protein
MQSVHLCHLSFIGTIGWFYMEAHRGALALYIIFYPVYLTVYPAVFLFALFYNPQKASEMLPVASGQICKTNSIKQ